MQETLLRIRYFEKGLQKVNLIFSFEPSLFLWKTMKNRGGLELVASLSSRCKTYLEKLFCGLSPA